jgi:FixJ family two-component response regulator
MQTEGRIIVIVEDDAGLHQAFKRVLSAAGHMPLIFDSAEALLAQGPIPGIECYVLDVRLPGKSGIELSRELDARGSEIPVIFITAHDEPAVHEAVERCGAAALLIKPFGGRKLLETLEWVFGRNAFPGHSPTRTQGV